MKKKILMIMLCGFMVLGLATGCGDKSSEPKKEDTNNESSVKKEEINIAETVSAFVNGYALVKGADDVLYVIDEEGNSSYKLESDEYEFINGYIITPGVKNYVMDGKGKTIFEKKDKREYLSISKCGNAMVRDIVESLGGAKSKYLIIDKNGKTIYTNDEYDFEYIYGDVYKFGSTLVNAKTGKTYTLDGNTESPSKKDNGYLYAIGNEGNHYIISEDLEKSYNVKIDFWDKFKILGLINDKYIYAEDKESNDKTYGIYDMKGTVVKDLTEGGIDKIFEYDGVYYVESITGYIYTLDSSFNYIANPISGYYKLYPSSIGVLGFKKDKVYLLDKNLEFNNELTSISDLDIDYDFMSYNDKFLYGDDGIIYNLETKKLLHIYK